MKNSVRKVLSYVVLAVIGLAGCSGSVSGTYTDPSGAFVLNLKSGGAATFAFAGQQANCTYKSDGKTVNLTCEGQTGALTLTVQSDGSLTGPPGTFMPPLRKK